MARVNSVPSLMIKNIPTQLKTIIEGYKTDPDYTELSTVSVFDYAEPVNIALPMISIVWIEYKEEELDYCECKFNVIFVDKAVTNETASSLTTTVTQAIVEIINNSIPNDADRLVRLVSSIGAQEKNGNLYFGSVTQVTYGRGESLDYRDN